MRRMEEAGRLNQTARRFATAIALGAALLVPSAVGAPLGPRLLRW